MALIPYCFVLLFSLESLAQNDPVAEYLNNYESVLNQYVSPNTPSDERVFYRTDLIDRFYMDQTIIYNHLSDRGTRHLTPEEYLDNMKLDFDRVRHEIQLIKYIGNITPLQPQYLVQYRLEINQKVREKELVIAFQAAVQTRNAFKGKILSIMPHEELVDGEEERKAADRERRAEATAWAAAERSDTKGGYEGYLEDYPDGAHAGEARSRINDMEARERAEAERHRAASKSPAEKAAEEIASTMVEIRGGTFMMGCTAEQGDDCDDDERPAHEVYVSGFELNKYEVTQAQWFAIMGRDPEELYNTGCDRCPVEGVSWNDAQKFIRELNRISNGNYRLPTEAEWEYAARGGQQSRGYKYSGSDRIDAVAWYGGNANAANNPHGSKGATRPVGGKQANELGLYDMSGNVYEWCSDRSGSDYYEESPRNNPGGPSSGSWRVLRGGCWSFSARDCRVSIRDDYGPGDRNYSNGFRLAR